MSNNLDEVKVLQKPGLDLRRVTDRSMVNMNSSLNSMFPFVARFWSKRWAHKKRKVLSRLIISKKSLQNVLRKFPISRSLNNVLLKGPKILSMRKVKHLRVSLRRGLS